MSVGDIFGWLTSAVQLALFTAVFLAVWHRSPFHATRLRVIRFGILWTVLVSVEFWAFGPWSFIPFAVEMDLSVPLYWFTGSQHDGGAYSHTFADGNDVAAIAFNTGQILSLERLLLNGLPLWVAQLIHRPLLAGLSFVGMYLLARRSFGAGRPIAAAIAAIQPVAHESISQFAWSHGLGYALIPLAVYLCVFRAGRRHYWPGVLGIAAINAVSSTPTHSNFALLAAVVLAATLVSKRNWPTIIGSLVILVVVLLANWYDSLLAKISIAVFTYRGADFTQAASTLNEFLIHLQVSTAHRPGLALLALAAIIVLARTAPTRLPVLGLLVLTGLAGGHVLNQIPWRTLGLSALSGINFDYMVYSLPILIGILTAVASRPPATWMNIHLPTVLTGIALGIAVALATGVKLRNAATWLGDGGVREVEIDRARLKSIAWPTAEPFRVVTIPYRLSPNLPAATGLSTLDGGFNLVLSHVARFWTEGVIKGYQDIDSGYVFLLRRDVDYKCCPSYNLTEIADPEFLRIANVQFVLSKVPLTGLRLSELSGLPEVAPPRNIDPLGQRLRGYFSLLLRPPPIFVYQLEDPLPRVYPARALALAFDRDLMAEIRRLAPTRVAVARPEDIPSPAPAAGSVQVINYRLGKDRIDIEVTARDSGLVIINATHTPFWSAHVDGRKTPIFPVNMVHMAVPIPSGSKAVALTYLRPSPWK